MFQQQPFISELWLHSIFMDKNKQPLNCLQSVDKLKKKKWLSLNGYCCCITSVVSDSVEPRRQQPTRLPRPCDSPGKNTGVGCHFLLHCMKVKSESEVAQSCPTLMTPWTAAYQAPPSMGFSRQNYWSGVPLPSPKWILKQVSLKGISNAKIV